MRTRKLLVLSAVAALGWAGLATAVDAPHDGSFATSVLECQSCHKLHGSTGGTLLNGYTSNNHACLTCHNSAAAGDNSLFTGDWSTREGIPGTSGDQHKWSGLAANATIGTRVPVTGAMSGNLLPGNNLQCATCHDVHGLKNASGASIQNTFAPNSAHASYRYNVAQSPIAGSGMTLTLLPVVVGAKPAGFYIKTTGTTTFQISHDYEAKTHATPPGTPTWSANLTYNTTGDVQLDDGTNVMVRFAGTAAAGVEWQFYVSYPFLNTSNTLDDMCLDCHKDRHQGWACVEGTGSDGLGNSCVADGTRKFSHPVGQALLSNGKGYDLAVPLDADGSETSSSTDGFGGVPNPGNDLKLVGGNVSCTTCHAPHNADSNSLTVDVR